MSIIIRLQNLPLSARSGDIRNFFGGLRIPDGGVHILGGDNGDAFIAFMSDEDARLAMRKDGGKIKGVRIKLFLSSYMEMQYEVEKITKTSFVGVPSPGIFNETLGNDFNRSKSSEKRRRSYSRSPSRYEDWKSRPNREHRRSRSKSPIIYNPRSRYKSRSPRISKSPMRSFTSQASSRKFIHRKRSVSPKMNSYSTYAHQLEETISSLSSSAWENSKCLKEKSQYSSQSRLQSELEKRITDELEKNVTFRKVFGIDGNTRSSNIKDYKEISHQHAQNDMFSPHTSAYNTAYQFQSNNFKQENVSFNYFTKSSSLEKGNQNDNFYILMSGLDPAWNFREIQMILKGVFAPQYNIRWEKMGKSKTDRVCVKLTNKDDFDSIVQKSVLHFKDQKIKVKECPESLINKYFQCSFNINIANDQYISQDKNLCYILKGLPFSCKYDDVVNFFHDLEIADILIFYGEDGRATGTGFISFTNWKDYEGAMMQNGKKIGHRYIELLPSTNREMAEAKKAYQGPPFVPYSKILSEKKSSSKRSLCAIITGLPLTTTTKKITSFFSESDLKPDAIHMTLNKKQLCDGRAFVEFSNFLDFDLALKFHGKRFDNKIVCVKQILYDEMMKILDSQSAKHYFGISDHTSCVSNEPEKVPYLWEPPDEELDKFDDSTIWSKDHKFGTSSNPNTKAPGNSSIERLSLGGNSSQFYADKQTTMSWPASKTFHSTKKYEDNIKLSKLSPENEAALLGFLNKDRKPSPDKTKSRDILKKRNEKDSRYNDDYRSPVQLDSLHFQDDRRREEDKACIVQLSNVNINAKSHELLTFLRGFDFYQETLIRGYTSEGEPTPDVRVTFRNRWEAEKAIKLLNKSYLQGQKVNMFIV